MKTLSEAISELFDIFPHRTAEEALEDAKATIDRLETFATGVLVGRGMSYDEAVEIIKRLED